MASTVHRSSRVWVQSYGISNKGLMYAQEMCSRKRDKDTQQRGYVASRYVEVLMMSTCLELKGTRLPLPDHTPSTHAPFLPSTANTNCSEDSSYSIRAWSRETFLSGPKSTSTWGDSEVDATPGRTERRPMVTVRV